MKKFLAVLALTGLSFATLNAQNSTGTKEVKKETTHQVAPAKSHSMPTATPKAASPQNTPKSKVIVKKDGTPDKRYSANRHLKKDGTPDRRYKQSHHNSSASENAVKPTSKPVKPVSQPAKAVKIDSKSK